ncbi:MAG: HAD family hydrolase [Acidimicrobiales bacterium]
MIFDFDGLMVDSETISARAVVDFMSERGARVRMAEFAHLFGATGADQDRQWRELFARWLGPDVDTGLIEAQLAEVVEGAKAEARLIPAAVELAERARSVGIKVGLATGKARPLLDADLGRHGLEYLFDAVITADEVPRGKPAPDIFIELARRLGADPTECLVLEDSAPGCLAGLEAGMTVVACPNPVTAGQTFPPGVSKVSSLAEIDLERLLTGPM